MQYDLDGLWIFINKKNESRSFLFQHFFRIFFYFLLISADSFHLNVEGHLILTQNFIKYIFNYNIHLLNQGNVVKRHPDIVIKTRMKVINALCIRGNALRSQPASRRKGTGWLRHQNRWLAGWGSAGCTRSYCSVDFKF